MLKALFIFVKYIKVIIQKHKKVQEIILRFNTFAPSLRAAGLMVWNSDG